MKNIEEEKLPNSKATLSRELYQDVADMVKKMFDADVRWLERMCDEELAQADINPRENTCV
jgi:hypothetical protein